MSPNLQSEIKQSRPFDGDEEEAFLNILRTAATLEHSTAAGFKPYGVTATQYNVLRILRGAGPGGLCRNEVSARMIRQVSDATRLLDRMAEGGLVERDRDSEDRRFVTARITSKGLELLKRLDGVVPTLHSDLLGHMSAKELQDLSALLVKARSRG
jgi:DNA-binding MarR family transcriptional regulator